MYQFIIIPLDITNFTCHMLSSPSGGRLLNFKGSQLWNRVNRLPKYLINIIHMNYYSKKLRYYLAYNPL